MKLPAILFAVGAAAVARGQFVIPRVDAHRSGISCVTRPTLMAGGGLPAGMAAVGSGGMAANPNPAAAFATFAPLLRAPAPANPTSVPGATPALGMTTPEPRKPEPSVIAARLLAYQREQAKAGSPSAQYALAMRYRTGDGVEADPRISRIWMEAAARQGSEEAARCLETVPAVATR